MERFTNLCCIAPRRLISKLQKQTATTWDCRGERERERERERAKGSEGGDRQIGFLGEVDSYAAQNSRPQDL
jgi:hypothetical protein